MLPDHSNLPLAFSYEEGDPPVERIHCRLWNRQSFVLHPEHINQYCKQAASLARRRRDTFAVECDEVFLEIIEVERLLDDTPPEGFWFIDLLRHRVIGRQARQGTEQEVAEKQAWLRQWGYGEDHPKEIISPFATNHYTLLSWHDGSVRKSSAEFIDEVQKRTKGILVPVESFYAASTFGLLALELLTTTGMRIMWNMN